MKWPNKDVVILVLLVCFVYPVLAGLWWNYFSGHAEPHPAATQVQTVIHEQARVVQSAGESAH